MLSDPNIVNPTFTADIVTDPNSNGVTHIYRLTITDDQNSTDYADVKVTIYPLPL